MVTGNQRTGGFTLFEILVVLFIVGLIVSLVVVNARTNPETMVATEARRLASIIEFAQDASIVSGFAIGLDIMPKQAGYQFVIFNDGWSAVDDSASELRQRELPAEMKLVAVLVNSEPTDLFDSDPDSNSDNDSGVLIPEVIITPDGLITAFEFRMIMDETVYMVHTPENSNIEFERVEK